MVDDDREDVVERIDPEQCGAHRGLRRDVEPGRRERDHRTVQFVDSDVHRGEVRDDAYGVHHHLVRPVRRIGEHRPQGLVSVEHVHQRDLQGHHVQVTPQAETEREVVGRRSGVEPVEEPHALLSQRQRDPVRAFLRDERGAVPRARVLLHPHRELLDGGRLEQHPHRHGGVQSRPEARDHLRSDQRVAAEREELVVQADRLDAEDVREDVRHDLLDRGPRNPERFRLEHRDGQRAPVDLARRGPRQGVDRQEHRRHHVRRQTQREVFPQIRGIERDGALGGRDDVRDELVTGTRVVVQRHHGLGHRSVLADSRLHFAELDTQSAQLHLEVAASHVLQFARAVGVDDPPHEVTGAVHPLARRPRIGDEPLRRQIGAAAVSACQLRAGDVQFPDHTGGHRVQAGVEDPHLAVPHRGTDRHGRGLGPGDGTTGYLDRGLGGAVQIVDRGVADAPDPRDDRRGERLTTAEHVCQRHTPLPFEVVRDGVEHRRNELHHRDRLLRQDPRQVRGIAVAVRRCHHDAGPGFQRPEQLPHRRVERDRGLEQHRVVGAEAVLVLHRQQLVDDCRMRDRHPLGATGRSGREQHVRGVLGTQRGTPGRVRQPRRRHRGQIQRVDVDTLHVFRQVDVVIGRRQDARGARGTENVGVPLGGLLGIDRHVRATGSEDGVHGREQFG
ncbi:hypothetical protein RE9427_36530 [Prescottella equi]|nr:hypothetical protein RE9427_36530 [Prescottella equi]